MKSNCVGIKLEVRITRQRWKAVHRRTHKAIQDCSKRAILYDRPGERMRGRSADASDGAGAIGARNSE
jgi:hypothetical protein